MEQHECTTSCMVAPVFGEPYYFSRWRQETGTAKFLGMLFMVIGQNNTIYNAYQCFSLPHLIPNKFKAGLFWGSFSHLPLSQEILFWMFPFDGLFILSMRESPLEFCFVVWGGTTNELCHIKIKKGAEFWWNVIILMSGLGSVLDWDGVPENVQGQKKLLFFLDKWKNIPTDSCICFWV